MTATLRVRSSAERDIERILDWYQAHSAEHAEAFLENLDETIRQVRDSPRLFRTVHGEVRRVALRRFPYFLWFIYIDEAELVQVIAVTHQRREPDATIQ